MTKDVIMDSRIGKKVRGIEKSRCYRDATIPSLATWVIQKLKADVGVQKADQGSSLRDSGEAGRYQNGQLRKSGPTSESFGRRGDGKQDDRSVMEKPTVSPRPQETARVKGKPFSFPNGSGMQSKSASHLLDLMSMYALCSFARRFVLLTRGLLCAVRRLTEWSRHEQ